MQTNISDFNKALEQGSVNFMYEQAMGKQKPEDLIQSVLRTQAFVSRASHYILPDLLATPINSIPDEGELTLPEPEILLELHNVVEPQYKEASFGNAFSDLQIFLLCSTLNLQDPTLSEFLQQSKLQIASGFSLNYMEHFTLKHPTPTQTGESVKSTIYIHSALSLLFRDAESGKSTIGVLASHEVADYLNKASEKDVIAQDYTLKSKFLANLARVAYSTLKDGSAVKKSLIISPE